MSTNYLALANYSFPTVNASSITVGSSINMNQAAFSTLTGSTITVSTLTGSTLNAGRITVSTIAFQSTTIALGQSTSQTNNFTNGSFTAGWASTLSTTASTAGAGLTAVQRVTMSQSGQYQLAVQSSVASYSVVKSSDSGVTWQTLTNGANGLPAGSPVYTSVSYSATGQYALATVNPGGLYVSNNATAATPTFTSITFAPYAYLPMETTPPTDTMGNSNPVSTGTPALATGQVGNAINLANTMGSTATKYIRGTWSGSNNFTVSGRFNAQSVTAGQYGIIFSALGTGITLYITDTAALVFFIGSSPTAGLGTGSNYVTSNTWYSFTIIYQLGGISSIYINGTLIGSVSNTGAVTNAYARTNLFGLGTYDNALSNAFNGYIDDFRIYNYATTATRWTHTAVSATGQYMLAAAAGGGLFQSSNYGQTWTQVNALLNGGVWTSLSQSASGQYALATTSAATIQPNLASLAVFNWSTNGVSWVVSASSSYSASYYPYYALQTAPTGAGWTALSTTYTTTTNASGVYTTIQGIGSVQGDWIQIQSSVPLIMSSYQLGSAGGLLTQFPKVFYILGSNDGTTWYPIQFGTIAAQPTSSNIVTIPGTIVVASAGAQTLGSSYITTTTYSTTTAAYTYFRMLYTANFASSATYLQLGLWLINFVGGLTCTSNYGQTWSNVANSLFTDFGALSGDGQYTLGVTNQLQPYAYVPLDNSTVTTGVGLTYSSTSGTVPFTTTARVGTHSANFSANTAGGGGSYLNYTVSSALNYPIVFTVSLWIYPTALPASLQACPFAFNGGSTGGGPYFSINPTTNYLNFGINATGGNVNITGSTATTINTWYHLVGICSNGTGYFYVNGTLVGTTSYTGIPSITGAGNSYLSNVFIGVNNTNGLGYAGYVDDVRIYMTALTPTAISQLYATPSLNPITNASLVLGSNYMTSLSSPSSYTSITLPNINAAINCASCSNTGQYMVVLTQGTTNNVYYSTNYGSTWTAVTVGSSPMTSCVMSADGTYITLSNATNVYTLNWNSQGYTLAIGSNAGAVNQASNAIAIGNNAGQTNQTANSIVLNASATAVNPYTQGFYVAPIAQAISSTAPTFPLLGYGSDNQIVQSTTSFSNSQQTVYGEWIQYQLATPSPITSYTLQGRNATAQRYPVSWIIVGSNDGTNWTLLDTETGTSGWGTYTVSQPTAAYTYYRMIITQIPSAAGYNVDIGAWILNNGSPIFGPSANYTVVASGLYNILQLNGTTVCTTTFSWANTTAVNSLGIGADGGANATYPPGWIPTIDAYMRGSTYFLGFSVSSFGPAYEYNSSGIAFQGTSTTINTTVLGNTNMSGMLCLSSGSRVGIGSTMPQYTLDVAGTAQVNGTIPAAGQPDSAAVVPNSTFGQTWTTVSGLSTSATWYGAAVSATGQYMTVCLYGTSAANIYYSANYGATWAAGTGYTANLAYAGVAMSGSGQYQLVGVNTAGGAIYLSTNYGAVWTAISGVTGIWFRYALSYTGQYQFIGESINSTGKVYYSSNYGASFTQVTAFTGNVSGGICCSSSGQYVTVTLSSGNIWYSSNYGVSWNSFATTAAWQGVCCSASGQYQTAALYNGSVYYSNNYGVSWTASSSGTANWVNVTCSASGQYQMATGNSMGVYYSTNYGVTWTLANAPSGNWWIAMSQNGLYTLGMITGGAVYLSTLTNVGLVTNGRIIATGNVITTTGNVGIGVTNPIMALEARNLLPAGDAQQISAGFRFYPSYTTNDPVVALRMGWYSDTWDIRAHRTDATGIQRLSFACNSSEKMCINQYGNVGIGIAGPGYPLHIYTSTQSVNPMCITQANSNGLGIVIQAGNAVNQSATLMYFVNYNNSVLRGTITSPTDSSTFYTSGSDRRIKHDIRDLPDIRSLVERLRPRGFIYNSDTTNTEHYGFIAQEVLPEYPHLVVGQETETSTLQLDYSTFSPFAVGGVLDLYKITDLLKDTQTSLSSQVNTLQATIAEQTSSIASLESQLAAQTSAQASAIAALEARLAALESK